MSYFDEHGIFQGDNPIQTLLGRDLAEFSLLDVVAIISFMQSISNVKSSKEDRTYNNILLNAISNEINLIHEELKTNIEQNNILIKQNDELLKASGKEDCCCNKEFKIPKMKVESKNANTSKKENT